MLRSAPLPASSGPPVLRLARSRPVGPAIAGLALLSLLLSLLLVLRAQNGGDQLNLLARGWRLAVDGVLVPYGNPGSSGGVAPGPATSVLVGLPLSLWLDARSPALLILVFHLVAFLLLDRLLRQTLRPGERLLYAVLFLLSPLRLFLSGFLWNPNYLFLAGAVHAATAFRQRRQARFFDSLLHVLTIGLAAQLHASAVLLALATLVLLAHRALRFHWPGAFTGAGLFALSLLPYLRAIAADPALLPGSEGFLGRGLLLVFPWVRGMALWLRYPSFSLSTHILQLDLTASLGATGDRLLQPLGVLLRQVIGPLSALVPLLALAWMLRRARRRKSWRTLPADASPRRWLESYVLCCLGASAIVFAIAPTTVMWWQGVALFHATLIPFAIWTAALLRSRRRRLVRRAVVAWTAASLAIVLGLAFGSRQYRCNGRDTVNLSLVSDHPMLHRLGMQQRCAFPLDVPDGWWPDVLPRATSPEGSTPATSTALRNQ